MTITVAFPVVNPDVREQPLLAVTLTILYVVFVASAGVGFMLKLPPPFNVTDGCVTPFI